MMLLDKDIIDAAKKAASKMIAESLTFIPIPFTDDEVTEEEMSLAVTTDQDRVIGGAPFVCGGKTFYVGMRIDEEEYDDQE